ncbi:mannose-1-phosphate guanylyltransferase [Calditerricola satsumensis]|uniref:mannose-1-phosphate guanylyltransferase n=1 Tax=Calditerricola satsumensis TaxID=373054 RepID=UPI000AD9CBE7|nr:mannose-1-phosphate guanylyltransferase [Calditerricola satsumensis]
MEVFSLIMAGGGGTRFWPLSRHAMPKQFLNISGNDTLINETIDRISSVISPSKTFVVTNKNQQAVLEQVLRDDIPKENVLYEPIGRNTAACIAYAALVIKKRYGDGILAVFPSDHYVTDRDGFVLVLKRCLEIAASTDSLVTIGIQPTFPATGYGYIRYDASVPVGDWAYRVEEFVEKPNFEKAKAYVRSGKYLWNSGMFVWKVSVILENFRRFLPRLYNKLAELEPISTRRRKKRCLRAFTRSSPTSPSITGFWNARTMWWWCPAILAGTT